MMSERLETRYHEGEATTEEELTDERGRGCGDRTGTIVRALTS
jgi:hypothetical protein